VLSAQLDASWSAVPIAAQYFIAGEFRVIARGNDSPRVQNDTVRVNAVNAGFRAAHRSAVLGFLKAYKKSVDWAFSGEPAVAAYTKFSDQPLDVPTMENEAEQHPVRGVPIDLVARLPPRVLSLSKCFLLIRTNGSSACKLDHKRMLSR
jgi:ABC-type nitrate/sulfonate/bicarbonate transport system substrate-binding protein